ncbi:hypothetical protein ACFY1C_30920 [Streptomyces sp. NPDC001279]
MTAPKAWWARVPAPVVDVVVAVAAADVLLNLEAASAAAQSMAALACAAIAARRRFPLTVFLLTLPASLMLDVVFAPFAALFTLAERSRNRRLLTTCAVLFALASAAPWPLASGLRKTSPHTNTPGPSSTSSTPSPPPSRPSCWANSSRPDGTWHSGSSR